jgi:LysR family transcriptional regulator, regulator for genes of the gallate degradation pathway
MTISLRHLRLVLWTAQTGSATAAAAKAAVSQPAVSSALHGVEASFGATIFHRSKTGFALTPEGAVVAARIERALGQLDPALNDLAPRLTRTATIAQLTALMAVAECESFSAAARALGLAQPSVHRAVRQIEREANRPLFDRTNQGVIPSRAVRQLAMAARLAFAELDQARADVASLAGREVGRIVIGAMPLSRAVLLGPAIAQFRMIWKTLPITVIEGPYAELALALRRGEADMLIGALRPPDADLTQETLFWDELAIIARPMHPAVRCGIDPALMAHFPWVVPLQGAPAREHFAAMFAQSGAAAPQSLVETSSMMLLCDLVEKSDHLGFVSRLQIARDLAAGRLVQVPFSPQNTQRPIGLTTRKSWQPTQAQRDIITALKAVAAQQG